jgi:hypothetical protein
MARIDTLETLRAGGAKVEYLDESTSFINKYLVRMPGRPAMRLTHQHIGGWKVSVGGKAFYTYSSGMTIGLVMGAPLSVDLMTPSQRAGFDQALAAGDVGITSPSLLYKQLYSLGFLDRLGKNYWRARRVTEVPNPAL